ADPADGSDARGIAESFRPQYDYMIAPNSTTRSFNSPDGLGADATTTTVAVAMSDTASTVTVTSAATIFAGGCIRIDNEWMKVLSKTNPPSYSPSVLTV